ncbi:MAG: site-specific DNA-methyltransferase [Chloroflexi bacterium]|nr:site-specific DNA-methyltransferase [Chloroflexota bacterium]
MTEQPERLDLRSDAIAGDKVRELLDLFPEVRTEGGQIDFDRLKLALGESVDIGKERYGLTWPGKADCFKTIQAPSLATLLPVPEESINWDTTENLIIEGDNLAVLKLLQKSYLGKVKMIYIDPPYNTGNDFIYPDNYSESLKTYLAYTSQVDAEGRRFSTNTDTDGRFHSKWLNMMYPRLYLARNLLRDDGVIFISIDDHEVQNLLSLGKEIFGEENFVGMVTRSTGTPTGGGADVLVNMVDYLVIFARSSDAAVSGLSLSEQDARIYDQVDEGGRRYLTRSLRRTGGEDRREDRPSMYYGITGPDGNDVFPIGPGGYESRWICGREKYEQLAREGFIEWKKLADRDGAVVWRPYQKFYLEGRSKQPSNLWTDVEGNKKATRDLRALFGDKIFDSPKPVGLIAKCVDIGCPASDGIILDFFAGSGTTAEAVLAVNKKDGGNRKFVLVQLPEPTGRGDYSTIAEIAKERVRRAIDKNNREVGGRVTSEGAGGQHHGFRTFKLAESNFRIWKADVPHQMEALLEQLELHVAHVTEDRSADDLLYEILLKSGYSLTAAVEPVEVGGMQVFSVADGALLVCLERHLTLETVRGMAECQPKPERVICLDDGFAGDDELKTNAVQLFKTREIVFRTA